VGSRGIRRARYRARRRVGRIFRIIVLLLPRAVGRRSLTCVQTRRKVPPRPAVVGVWEDACLRGLRCSPWCSASRCSARRPPAHRDEPRADLHVLQGPALLSLRPWPELHRLRVLGPARAGQPPRRQRHAARERRRHQHRRGPGQRRGAALRHHAGRPRRARAPAQASEGLRQGRARPGPDQDRPTQRPRLRPGLLRPGPGALRRRPGPLRRADRHVERGRRRPAAALRAGRRAPAPGADRGQRQAVRWRATPPAT
jgi:hypothetical protein